MKKEIQALFSTLADLDAAVAAHYGLDRAEVRCLELLRSGPMQPKELAAAMGYTSGGITDVLDRLESHGYIIRQPHATDRRSLRITTTPQAKRREIEVWSAIAEALEEATKDLSDSDLALVIQTLQRLQQLVRVRIGVLRRRS